MVLNYFVLPYEGEGNNPPPQDDKKFSQKDVDKIVADERRKQEKKFQDTITQLEALKENKNLTERQQAELQTRIEEMQTSMLSKEEQAKREQEKIKKESENKINDLTKDRDGWQNRYVTSEIRRSIMDAATEAKAFSPEQLVRLLQHDTKMTQILDEAGKPTDEWIPKVKIVDTKDGKPVTLELTVPDAIKLMKDQPNKYGNLFESGVSGGLGVSSGAGGGKGDNEPPRDPVRYREWRKNNLKQRR